MKKIAIIIVTYNRPNEVKRAIVSCMPLDEKDVELIVWDNHSNKQNREKVESFCNDYKFPIKYFYSENNLGPGGGKNAAWLKSNAEYVFIMDDDAVIGTNDFFDKLISYMDKHTEAGAAYVNIYEPATKHNYNCKIKIEEENIVKPLAFVGGGHVIRKEIFPQKNLYPSNFMFGAEELYASLIIWDAGYEIHEIENLQVLHLPTANNRVLGKERDKNILIASFLVKTFLYPKSLHLICYLLLRVKLIKNQISWKQCKALIIDYQNFIAESRISANTILWLIQKYGIKNVL